MDLTANQPKMTESESLDYFKTSLFLPTTNGIEGEEIEDKNVVQKLKTLHRLFQGTELALKMTTEFLNQSLSSGKPVSSSLSDLLSKFMDESDTGNILTHWSKYRKHEDDETSFLTSLSLLLIEISEQILKKYEYDGQLSLKLLGYLATLENVTLDVGLCFLIFYGKEMAGDSHGSNPQHLDDLSKLQFLLGILEKYYLVKVTKEGDTAGVENSVQIPRVIQVCLRRQQKEGEDWSFVFDLINLFNGRTMILEKYFCCIKAIHFTLKEFSWPEASYRHSLYFAAAIWTWIPGHRDDVKGMLGEIYGYFVQLDDGDEVDEENFNLCRILLFLVEYEKRKEGMSMSGEIKFFEEIDNSQLYQETDDLWKISRGDFFEWILDQAVQFERNELIQHFAGRLLLNFVTSQGLELNREQCTRMTKWVNQFNHKILRGNYERLFVISLTDLPLKVMQIACEVFTSVEVIKMAINLMRACIDLEGETNGCWFLLESFYLMKPSAICVWEGDQDSDDLDDIQDFCEIFVEQGMNTFIHMLTTMNKEYNENHRINEHFILFLETIQSVAFFDDCVTTFLESIEFFDELKILFNAIVEGIEEQKDHENIKVVCHILVFWYSLVSNPDNSHHGTAVTIIEELKNFSERFSEEQSPVVSAFDSELHWHRGFREQGRRTSEKILDNFIKSRRNSSTDHAQQLAKRLKSTMNQKQGWSLVS